MYTITTRNKYNFYDIRSAFQKAVRRCKKEDVLYITAELDMTGLGNMVFNCLIEFCGEDVGPADIEASAYILYLYSKWKDKLKELKLKTSMSFTSPVTRDIIMRAASIVADCKKSRVACYLYQVAKYQPAKSKLNAFDHLIKCIEEKDELTASAIIVQLLENSLTRNMFDHIWDILIQFADKNEKGIYTVPNIMRSFKTNTYHKKVFIRHMFLITGLLLVIRNDHFIYPIIHNETSFEHYYDMDLKQDVMHDYVFDKHTLRGKQLGRGLEHFYKVGAHCNNIGFPELYKEEVKLMFCS